MEVLKLAESVVRIASWGGAVLHYWGEEPEWGGAVLQQSSGCGCLSCLAALGWGCFAAALKGSVRGEAASL